MSETLATRLYGARKALEGRLGRDVTHAEVGKALGVHAVTYGGWERGKYQPKLEQVAQLAAFYDVDPAYLAWGIITAPLKEVPPGTPNAVPISRELPPPQVPAKEVSRHKKAPLHRPTRDADEGKGRKKA